MKLNKNIVIPMILVIFSSVMAIFISKAPLTIALSPIIVLVPALIIQNKRNNSFVLMLITGLISAFLYVGILILLGFLAKEHTWAEIIFNFPY